MEVFKSYLPTMWLVLKGWNFQNLEDGFIWFLSQNYAKNLIFKCDIENKLSAFRIFRITRFKIQKKNEEIDI